MYETTANTIINTRGTSNDARHAYANSTSHLPTLPALTTQHNINSATLHVLHVQRSSAYLYLVSMLNQSTLIHVEKKSNDWRAWNCMQLTNKRGLWLHSLTKERYIKLKQTRKTYKRRDDAGTDKLEAWPFPSGGVVQLSHIVTR